MYNNILSSFLFFFPFFLPLYHSTSVHVFYLPFVRVPRYSFLKRKWKKSKFELCYSALARAAIIQARFTLILSIMVGVSNTRHGNFFPRVMICEFFGNIRISFICSPITSHLAYQTGRFSYRFVAVETIKMQGVDLHF